MTRGRITVEVCVDSVESAVNAVNAGADRLELCGNLGLGGGTTPTLGLLRAVKRATAHSTATIMAMVRPRTGDFLYTAAEFDIILDDIRGFKQAGAHGIVCGVLKADGTIDVSRTEQIISEASPMEVCFHRAFDMTRNPEEAFKALSGLNKPIRILTSGHGPTAPSSLEALAKLLELASHGSSDSSASHSITIMPGSGINSKTIRSILDALLPHGLEEVHLSGGRWIEGNMMHRPSDMGMGVSREVEWSIWRTVEGSVREVRRICDEVSQEYSNRE